MNLAKISGALALNALAAALSGASLVAYSGTQPANPETALSGNTVLDTWTFSSPAASADPSYTSGSMSVSLSVVTPSETPVANGTCTFMRATVTSAAWVASHSYAVGAIVSNSSNYYLCTGAGTSAASGGPTTTGPFIADGTVTWLYLGATAGEGNVLMDFTAGSPWTASTAVVVSQKMTNGGNTYVCTAAGTTASSGGPSGTGAGITDGSVTWNFLNAGSPDAVLGNAVLGTGVPVTLNSIALAMPVS